MRKLVVSVCRNDMGKIYSCRPTLRSSAALLASSYVMARACAASPVRLP